VFFRENQPPYHKIYRKLAQTAGIVRICDSDHPYVRLTEHIIDESTLYVAAINYSNKPAIANLTVLPEYRISAIYGHKLEGTTLHLRENDGILLKLTKD
ncbi:MAG: hypothetical protein IKM13_02730, partial [Clostridia bacterium]|nr:hypothetical protein [Clostridia bacterium]